MLNAINAQKPRSKTIKYNCLAALLCTTLIAGCDDNDDSKPVVLEKEGKVNFILASVEGGACSLHDPYSNMAKLAGPVSTSAGVGIFKDINPETGLVVVECSGGTYEDEATGESMTPGVFRSYINITTSEFTATVTPLTEIATRIVEGFELTPEEYAPILENVAYSFGLKGVDLATVVPLDLNVDEMDGSERGNYGLVLAALSQLQNDYEVGTDAEAIVEELYSDMANNGLFTSDRVREFYCKRMGNGS